MSPALFLTLGLSGGYLLRVHLSLLSPESPRNPEATMNWRPAPVPKPTPKPVPPQD